LVSLEVPLIRSQLTSSSLFAQSAFVTDHRAAAQALVDTQLCTWNDKVSNDAPSPTSSQQAAEDEDLMTRRIPIPSLERLFLPPSPDCPPALIPTQRRLTHAFTRHNTPTSINHLTPAGGERVRHLAKQTIEVAHPDSVLSGWQDFETTRGKLSFTPGLFLASISCAEAKQAQFPKAWFSVFLAFWLGLLMPSTTSCAPGKNCSCGTEFDIFGHHAMNCSSHAQFKTSHNLLSQTLDTCSYNSGLVYSNSPGVVPKHPGWNGEGTCKRQGDAYLLLPNDGLTGPSQRVEVVIDFKIVHPRVARDGAWKSDALARAAHSKRQFHEAAYRGMNIVFAPAVASTYGHLHHEFVRLLFLMASRQAKNILTFDSPDAVLSFKQLRGMCFNRFKSAVSFAVAKGMVMRATGVGCRHVRFPTLGDFSNPELVNHDTYGPSRPIA
jgi:hypothetical protein